MAVLRKRIEVYLTEEQRKEVERRAKALHMNISGYVRFRILI